MSFASTLRRLSTPMLIGLLAADTNFAELNPTDQQYMTMVGKVLWYRNWPGGLSDEELYSGLHDIPMGQPLQMIFDEMGKRGLDPIEAKKQVFRKAQMLSQNFRNGKGLVVITPLQANKDGMDKAAKREGDDCGVYESLAAVDWYTQAAQDMDTVISVWHDANLQMQKLMKLSCLKTKGHFFPTHLANLDERTMYTHDPGKARERDIAAELEAII
jgi:hypothetical protein